MGAPQLDAPTLAALMCSRLCHDLVAPVSAVKNALEVYNDPSMPDSREQALKVIDQAAASAAAKLEFLRVAFGAAGIGEHSADADEAGRVAERFFSAMKPELSWRPSTVQPPLTFVRLMYNLALIALDALPRGGTVEVDLKEEGGVLEAVVKSTGPKAALRPTTMAALRGELPEGGYDGRSVQQYFTGVVAASLGADLNAREGQDVVELIARLKVR
ncbi:MAG: histidine phosphotransferase family protein [Caulobacterales bacterium]